MTFVDQHRSTGQSLEDRPLPTISGEKRSWDPGRWVGEGRGTGPGPHDARVKIQMSPQTTFSHGSTPSTGV